MLSGVALKLFTLNKLKGVGPSTLRKLLSFPDFSTASIEELALRDNKLANSLAYPNAYLEALNAVEADLSQAEKHNARIISLIDNDYPILLKQTNDCPIFIYVKGNLQFNQHNSIGIIGTRSPTQHGSVVTERVSAFFVNNGWSIVSGLAIGCDAIAHECAVKNRSHTIAVLAHGLHTIAPKQHEKLAHQILDVGGVLLSEYAFGVEPIPAFFAKRDRIQAGLSRGIVMIQSDLEGGSLHASRAIVEYQRILAVPYPTNLDVSNLERKVQANLLLCSEDIQGIKMLLKCNENDTPLIHVLKSKDDYANLLNQLSTLSK